MRLKSAPDVKKSLREIASHFDDTIKANAEAVIAKYRKIVDEVIAKYKPRLEGKTVMLYVGGLRPRHVIGAYEDLGMEVIGTGYEFAHNDDYDRTIKEMGDATLLYDDVTGFELEEFVKRLKPDMVGSGIKEKYIFQKMGIPFRQMHSWDYSGPYHGYDGFAIFARDMDLAVLAHEADRRVVGRAQAPRIERVPEPGATDALVLERRLGLDHLRAAADHDDLAAVGFTAWLPEDRQLQRVHARYSGCQRARHIWSRTRPAATRGRSKAASARGSRHSRLSAPGCGSTSACVQVSHGGAQRSVARHAVTSGPRS